MKSFQFQGEILTPGFVTEAWKNEEIHISHK